MLAVAAVLFYIVLATFSTAPVVAGICLLGMGYSIYWSVS